MDDVMTIAQPRSDIRLPSTHIGKHLVSRAIRRDEQALKLMFQQFIGDQEEIIFVDYLGLRGLWHIGMHSFVCLTSRRVCNIEVGWLGRVVYEDAYIEDCNSGTINQPTLIFLYIISFVSIVSTFGAALVILPFIVRIYYRYVKLGATIGVRQGRDIRIFADRKELVRLNRMWRLLGSSRDARIDGIRKGAL